MQQNSANIIDDVDNQRSYSSMNMPSHGKLPKWLDDMSNNVQGSRSVSDSGHYYSNLYLEMNNNKEKVPNLGENAFEIPRSSESTGSAKHGRRALLSTEYKPPTYEDLNGYIVPNFNNIDLKDLTTDTNKPLTCQEYYRHEVARRSKNKKVVEPEQKNVSNNNSVSELENVAAYSPSVLEKENGRRSRGDILDDTLLFNDLLSAITDFTYNNPKQKFKPEVESNNSENVQPISNSSFPIENKKNRTVDNKTSDNATKTNDSKLFTNTLTPANSNVSFEETYKSKLQKNNMGRKFVNSPNKRMRYKKFKYKQGSSIISKKDAKKIDLNRLSPKEKENKIQEKEEIFIIPELPRGSRMVLNILSTWGDKYYVGLNGIELFGSDGNAIQVKKVNAVDINILPECVDDPRVASNLFDGVNRTHDDAHLWLAPFDNDQDHKIDIEFVQYSELAMMRIWNYNKSRIHSYRGAKYIIITLDDVPIFKGEIAQACGSVLGSIESFGDTILFTTDESILEKISRNDEAFTTLILTSNSDTEKIDRPTTATAPEEPPFRPYTHPTIQKPQEEQPRLIGMHRIDLVLILNWGKPDIIGLTGFEVIGESNEALPVNEKNLLSNYKGNLNRLIDGENLTNNSKHMWAVKFSPSKNVVLSIIFDTYTYVAGIRLWNYNENIEATYAGVRIMKIFLDNKLLPNPFTKDSSFYLRRAPGNIHYDYVQEIHFTNPINVTTSEALYEFNEISQFREESFEQPNMPEGFVFQIVIYTTWGDQYYVGLNGIEMYDHLGRMILLTESNICAHPESVNVLPGVSGDIRTPDKLIDGINDAKDGAHSWLAPVIPKCLNRIYIVMDQPITVSVIKLWNYFKTPARGVKEFGILVDDLLVYNGILDRATDISSVKYRSILFTNNADVIRKEMATLVKHSIDSQGTVLTNDKLRMTTGGSLPNVDQSLRPFTSVNQLYRGRTSQSN